MPSTVNLSRMSERELLQLHFSILEELIKREVVRTRNNPVADYTEWLVSNALDLTLESNSKAGFDATDRTGTRYQIKSRHIHPANSSRQLGAIRQLEDRHFEILAGVIFDVDYNILDAVLIPHDLVAEYATYRKHVNGHVLHLRGPILDDPRISRIGELEITKKRPW